MLGVRAPRAPGSQHAAVDALLVEPGRVDVAHLLADAREFARGPLARGEARIDRERVEVGYAEQRGVVGVVAVLGREVLLAEPGELACGRRAQCLVMSRS